MWYRDRGIRSERGSALIEFALVFMLLMLLLFGIIEFGLMLYDEQVLTNAAREGARAGIIQQNPRVSDAAIKAVVTDYAAAHLVTFGNDQLTASDVTITRTGTNFGNSLTVRVNFNYDFVLLPSLIEGMVGSLQATSVMKYE